MRLIRMNAETHLPLWQKSPLPSFNSCPLLMTIKCILIFVILLWEFNLILYETYIYNEKKNAYCTSLKKKNFSVSYGISVYPSLLFHVYYERCNKNTHFVLFIFSLLIFIFSKLKSATSNIQSIDSISNFSLILKK